jgi:pre-mRNA-splicing factor CDC5/CEF1
MEEQDEKRKKQKKGGEEKNQSSQFIAAREAQIQKLKETEQIIKRRKLNLPQPQVGESELEDIVKIGRSSRTALDLVGSSADAGQASDKLIGEYDGLNKARMARTPMTAPQGELSSSASLRW